MSCGLSFAGAKQTGRIVWLSVRAGSSWPCEVIGPGKRDGMVSVRLLRQTDPAQVKATELHDFATDYQRRVTAQTLPNFRKAVAEAVELHSRWLRESPDASREHHLEFRAGALLQLQPDHSNGVATLAELVTPAAACRVAGWPATLVPVLRMLDSPPSAEAAPAMDLEQLVPLGAMRELPMCAAAVPAFECGHLVHIARECTRSLDGKLAAPGTYHIDAGGTSGAGGSASAADSATAGGSAIEGEIEGDIGKSRMHVDDGEDMDSPEG